MSLAMLDAIDCIIFQDAPADPSSAPPLLLTSRDAARLLAISERTLWGLTKVGKIPVVRIGRSIRYDRHDLTRWIEQNKTIGL